MLEHRNEIDLEPMHWTTMAHIVHHNPAYIYADVAVTEALCTLLVQRTPTVPVSASVVYCDDSVDGASDCRRRGSGGANGMHGGGDTVRRL
jgi:hypothetical protein